MPRADPSDDLRPMSAGVRLHRYPVFVRAHEPVAGRTAQDDRGRLSIVGILSTDGHRTEGTGEAAAGTETGRADTEGVVLMAGDWIKIEHATIDKPEVMVLAERLDMETDEVVGKLLRFWIWVDRNVSEKCPRFVGTLSGLDRVVFGSGFAQALIDVGWLSYEAGEFSVPNYEQHLSHTAKTRAKDSKRKKETRTLSGQNADKTRTHSGLEKRREEKSIKRKAAPSQKFAPPTAEQVREYCQSRGNSVDPEQFIDHYEANGWIRGKSKLKDWKAAVRTWEKRQNEFTNRSGTQRNGRPTTDQSIANLAAAAGLFPGTGTPLSDEATGHIQQGGGKLLGNSPGDIPY